MTPKHRCPTRVSEARRARAEQRERSAWLWAAAFLLVAPGCGGSISPKGATADAGPESISGDGDARVQGGDRDASNAPVDGNGKTDGSVAGDRDSGISTGPGDGQTDAGRDAASDPPVQTPIQYPKDGFCNEAGVNWGWCEDFDGQGTSSRAAFDPARAGIALRVHSYMTPRGVLCETSGDCTPYVQGGALFLNPEDSGFGMNVLRVKQPFDFAGREGRVHYRSDMKAHGRMHQNVHISPTITNNAPDLRFVTDPSAVNRGPAIDIEYLGPGLEPFGIFVYKDGVKVHSFNGFGPITIPRGEQHDVDIYVSRTRVRVLIDGKEVGTHDIPDLGFDRGYVYFEQLSYNPVKDNMVGAGPNTFLWDNFAFDGPSLAANSLTPANQQDILFRAYGKSACTVRGVQAQGVGTRNYLLWDTWSARLPASDPAVTLTDITCTTIPGGEQLPFADRFNKSIDDIEVVKQ
jgi:hypothetical protein